MREIHHQVERQEPPSRSIENLPADTVEYLQELGKKERGIIDQLNQLRIDRAKAAGGSNGVGQLDRQIAELEERWSQIHDEYTILASKWSNDWSARNPDDPRAQKWRETHH